MLVFSKVTADSRTGGTRSQSGRSAEGEGGEDLFQYMDDEGVRQTIGSGDVNDYIKEISGEEFTAKDFRTWAGTILAVGALTAMEKWSSQRRAKSNVLRAIDQVAEQLNNTRAVCRKYYVHPAVFETYLAGAMPKILQNGTKEAAKADLTALQLCRRPTAPASPPSR